MLPERVSADVEGAPHDALRPPPPLRPAHSCWTARPSACPGGAGARSPGGHQIVSILRSLAIPAQGREAIQAETHATPAIAPSRARVTRTRRTLRLRRSPRARVVSGARLSSAAFTRGHSSRRSPCLSSGPESRRSGSKPMSRSWIGPGYLPTMGLSAVEPGKMSCRAAGLRTVRPDTEPIAGGLSHCAGPRRLAVERTVPCPLPEWCQHDRSHRQAAAITAQHNAGQGFVDK